ncbi:hypothetical protein BSL78_26782 [Apostichopus japonicus]|uniref:Peptidase A2 domain-containing protein n=1 Tax=Stichopus japonicus TaxID=307972 RepID=A0A2G8JKW9_STIJA|nr:hypothetical protein BSL78_26782 [Apostichopus japonicus]
METVDAQMRAMELEHNHGSNLNTEKSESVNRVGQRSNQVRRSLKGAHWNKNKKGKAYNKDNGCYCCGREGRFSRDLDCPAKDEVCTKRHLIGHFAKMCKTKPERYQKGKQKGGRQNWNRKGDDDVNLVDLANDFAFAVTSSRKSGVTVDVKVGGVNVEMLIDSGASCNIIDKKTWDNLKQQRITCESAKIDKTLYPYGGGKPLNVLGKFATTAKFRESKTEATLN